MDNTEILGKHEDAQELAPLKAHQDSLYSLGHEKATEVSFHASLANMLSSYRFHVVILVLVGLDCILVFGELMIDYLRLFQNHACNATQGSYANESTKELENYHTLETIEKTFHYSSIGILGLFVVEVVLKLIAFGYTFFYQFEELIDAIIIIVSFTLDIAFIKSSTLKFLGLLIFLRLWRIVRIVHAIIIAVLTPIEDKLEQEERKRSLAERKLKEALEEIETLKHKLISQQEAPTSHLTVRLTDPPGSADKEAR